MKCVARSFVLLLVLSLPLAGFAQEGVVIQAFESAGQLTFSSASNSFTYRVEWAPAVDGPWTNYIHLPPTDADSVTVTVPMVYRVVAVPPPEGMIFIAPGTNSGDWSNPADHEPLTYSLTVDWFYMDRHEVTKALWDEVRVWGLDHGYTDLSVGTGKETNHPVVEVSWYDAVKWCNARSEMEGRPAVYVVDGIVYRTGQFSNVVQTAVAGYRLPTKVEWEYAARGGVSSQRFPWGNEINHDWANYHSWQNHEFDTNELFGYHPVFEVGNEPYTAPVGSFAPNGYGFYDMSGNVSEWCFDMHTPEPFYFNDRRDWREYRGGSWVDDAAFCRVENSWGDRPHRVVLRHVGFRTVLSQGQ